MVCSFFVHVLFSVGLGPRHYTVHLRAVLLLQFMEHLDKLMYNAYEGSCVTLPPVPKVSACTIARIQPSFPLVCPKDLIHDSIVFQLVLNEWLPVSKSDWS